MSGNGTYGREDDVYVIISSQLRRHKRKELRKELLERIAGFDEASRRDRAIVRSLIRERARRAVPTPPLAKGAAT